MSKVTHYFITISPIRKGYYTKSQLRAKRDEVKETITKAEWFDRDGYEVASRGCLHYHAVFVKERYTKAMEISKMQDKIFNTKIVRFPKKDLNKILNYCTKNTFNKYEQEKQLIHNYAMNYCMFI